MFDFADQSRQTRLHLPPEFIPAYRGVSRARGGRVLPLPPACSRPVRAGADRQYQAHLFTDRKLDANTVAQHLSALRFFIIKTLKRNWSVEETPYPKRPIRLPDVLSRDEVERLIDSADNRLHRVWLLTRYATGLRREELVRLKVRDIDNARMVLHFHQGKGNQDRDIMLSPGCWKSFGNTGAG
jgi:site-specific recombinase XerD